MTSSVGLQSGALNEGLTTVVADIRALTTVNLLVTPQCTRSGEVFATDKAAVWFEARVAPHVGLHVLESLPADTADPASLSV